MINNNYKQIKIINYDFNKLSLMALENSLKDMICLNSMSNYLIICGSMSKKLLSL